LDERVISLTNKEYNHPLANQLEPQDNNHPEHRTTVKEKKRLYRHNKQKAQHLASERRAIQILYAKR